MRSNATSLPSPHYGFVNANISGVFAVPTDRSGRVILGWDRRTRACHIKFIRLQSGSANMKILYFSDYHIGE